MANLTYNNSLYTRINKWDDEYSYKGVFVASKLNQKNGQDYKLLDAIDIDWDGIWFSSLGTYINTTDDLIEILNHINTTSDVNIFREQIDNINELLDTITASYVNTSYLGEVLTAYQQTLIAGPNIKIDKRTNVITTYGFLTYELLTAYATVAYVTDLRNEIYVNFPTINESYIIAYAQARSVVDAVIDGADKAFDTLKEIADWINAQSHYEPVAYSELVQDGEYIATFDVYIHTGGDNYELVSQEYVIEHPEVQYYRLSTPTTEIDDLYNKLEILDERVGHKTPNGDDTYSYTGLVKDIYDLQQYDRYTIALINGLQSNFDTLETLSISAYNTAYRSYTTAYSAYTLATYSLSITTAGIDEAHIAYEMAYKASVDVGVPTVQGEYVVATEEDITNGVQLYHYDELGHTYHPATYRPDADVTWYTYIPGHDASGLTKRVEDVEETTEAFTNRVSDLSDEIERSLYNLHANNENSAYVQLSFTPEEYDGLRDRTINITTYNALFVTETGEVLEDGLVTIDIARDIYSYAATWEILPSPSAEEPENGD